MKKIILIILLAAFSGAVMQTEVQAAPRVTQVKLVKKHHKQHHKKHGHKKHKA
ncbi:MAG TPA: hypothetical protein VH413_14045 [Verrucomicrobiae bacterium]|nr:hypothetical protein [Verrucomicrobiae bacterium]